jgi:hypothetical protein
MNPRYDAPTAFAYILERGLPDDEEGYRVDRLPQF